MKLIEKCLFEFERKDDDLRSQIGIGISAEIEKEIEKAGIINPTNERNFLYFARTNNSPQIIKYLRYIVSLGIDLKGIGRETLAHHAANGNLEIVELMIKAKAGVEHKSNFALRMAVRNQYEEIVELLLKAGAKTDAKYNDPIKMSERLPNQRIKELIKEYTKK